MTNRALVLLGIFFLAGSADFVGAEIAFSPPLTAVISPDNPSAFDPAEATAAWLNTVPPEKRAKSDAYFEGGYWLILWNFLLTVAIAMFLLFSRISERLRDFAERWSPLRPLQVVIYTVSLIVVIYALEFPLTVYDQFFREHAYGLATQNFGQWFAEQLIALALQAIIFSAGLIGMYRAFRLAPRTWWLWTAGASVVCLPIYFILTPVFVEPLFNKYTALTDAKISQPILAMARANQIPVTQVFEVDASRQTTRVSANVAGFLGTTRIALNDNLLKQCTVPEIREVMGHEMGHYILNHTMKFILELGVSLLLAFAIMRVVFDAAVRRWGQRWGIRGISDLAGLPLLMWIFATIVFFFTPITNTMVRVAEREADAFGLNTAREPDAMAMVALKLGTYRKLNPTPLEEFVFFDHPSGRARIRMAMDWKGAQLPCGNVDPGKSSAR